ncbi:MULTISPECIES: permease-like cell division protein FtsX [Microbispora]|uniref:Cell division protein FtsX n=3 Tax=Microbispora TaxID=2005 RepID=A0ABY3LVB8_9ACTN|nr:MULTISPECIES: permease-like cell division protein FtsX [Microbispora]GLW21712.1 cell division protein FtsX [Microbispora amethystogenes]MBO4272236.1 FtsX-like permease family protein [Microbispora triticiradicis]RGA05354.1 ABC transporter permease [Microbispora triticiradicis]TLP61989.1 ABC transporter permease [Microbispora fusca]TYB56081.1 ABC transporter permease [Microbispora tritici]
MRANFIFSEVWIGLRRNLTMTIAVIVTVAVGMALLGVGLMINSQVSKLTGFWSDKVELSVYLCVKGSPFDACKNKGAVTQEEKGSLEQTIRGLPEVESVKFETQAEAYKNWQNTENNTLLLSVTKVEDMPESFRVKLKDPEKAAVVASNLKGQPGVSNVVNERDLLQSVFGFMDTLRNMALGIAILMVFAATLLIGNTVRLSAYNRRRETGIMRLVGASNIYIQLPFVMEGLIAGLIGGVLSGVLLILVKIFIFEEIQTYMVAPLGWDTVAGVITGTMAIGVLICVFASFVTLRRYLRV